MMLIVIPNLTKSCAVCGISFKTTAKTARYCPIHRAEAKVRNMARSARKIKAARERLAELSSRHP